MQALTILTLVYVAILVLALAISLTLVWIYLVRIRAALVAIARSLSQANERSAILATYFGEMNAPFVSADEALHRSSQELGRAAGRLRSRLYPVKTNAAL